jgi:hypothetical protein
MMVLLAHAGGCENSRHHSSHSMLSALLVVLTTLVAMGTTRLCAAAAASSSSSTIAATDVLYSPPSSCAVLPSHCLPGQCKSQRKARTACLTEEAGLLHNRTLSEVVGGLPTVLDFGAQVNSSTDDTPSFNFALAHHPTLRVPPGAYRIDGTVTLGSTRQLILDAGATLIRYNVTLDGTVNTNPIIRFLGHSAAVSGSGVLEMQVASPRGIVNFGPFNLTHHPAPNLEYNSISGIYIAGAGCSFDSKGHDTDVSVRGSRGVCFDSGEGYGAGGSCYQNSVRDVTIVNVDTGVYFGKQANANSATGIMFYRIGQYSYLFNGENSENTIQGGFTAGFGGNVTIMYCHKCYYNHFSGVQAEPGPGSRYFYFDNHCLWNTVIGHDNTYHGAESYDSGFIYMNSGALHLGNYNGSAHFNTSIEHPADINRSLSLQVQGRGYIKELTHGLPRRASAVADGGESATQGGSLVPVETVEDRPHVLIQPGRRLVIANLSLNATAVPVAANVVSAAYYQITLSGAGVGGECSGGDAGGYAVFSAQYVVTPLLIRNLHRLHVKQVLAGSDHATAEGVDSLIVDGVIGFSVDHQLSSLIVQLLDCTEDGSRELVVDAKRVGRQATQPVARVLKTDDGSSHRPDSGAAVTLFVNPSSDHDGGDGSAANPLKSLQAAQVAARRVIRRQGAQEVTIRASAGVYSPLTLTQLDSGTDTHSMMRFEGAPGAVISGGVALPPGDFTNVPPTDPIFERLPASTRAATQRFNLSSVLSAETLHSLDAVSGSVQLSCGGNTLALATWPGNGSWAHTGTNISSNGFIYPADAPLPTDAADAKGLWLEGYFVFDWADSRIPVTSLFTSNHTLFADTTSSNYVHNKGHFNAEARFRFINLPELLQRSGYWLDHSTSMLYVAGGTSATCTLAVAQTALTISNATHISVSGFTIESARDSIVAITDSSFVSLRQCTVRSGLAGIAVMGGEHVSISDVEAMSLGATAISISGGDRLTLRPGFHSVSNCTIHDYAKILWCYHPGIKIEGVGHTVTQNEIHSAPHQGILVNGNDHRIAFNVFHDLLLESFDSGAIYKSDRDWTTRGLVMDSNFFYHLGSTSLKCNPHTACCRHGIYMDATEHGFTAIRNLIIQPPELQSSVCNYGIFDNGGRNNRIASNLCVGYPTCVRIADYNLISTPQFSEQMVKNFQPFQYRHPPYSAYPGLAALDSNISFPLIGNCSKREQCGSAPWHVEVTGNVAINGSARLIPYGPETSPDPSLTPGRFNFSGNANVTMSAVGFEAADPSLENCWAIKTNSAIFGEAKGFEQIQLGMVGPPAYRAAYATRCTQTLKSDDELIVPTCA